MKEFVWKGTQSNDARWPEDIDNVQTFSFAGLMWLFHLYLCNRSTFFFQIWGLQGAAMLVHSLPMKSRQWVAHGIPNTSAIRDDPAIQADLVHDITDKDCQMQNGSTHSHVFVTFECQFLTNQTLKFVVIWCPQLTFSGLYRTSLWNLLSRHHGWKFTHDFYIVKLSWCILWVSYS